MTKNIEKTIDIIGSIENNSPTRIEFQILELFKLKNKMIKIQNTQISLLPLEIRKINGHDVKISKTRNSTCINLYKITKINNKLKIVYNQIDKFVGNILICR
jgi:hypothetical protein